MSFFQKPKFTFVAIGDIATDAFIRIKQASVNCNVNHEACTLSLAFGSKVPYEFSEIVPAVGNSANAAVSAARIGLSSALISNIGKDLAGNNAKERLTENGVSTRLITAHKDIPTNYHYVLWYGDERTILVRHEKFPYELPEFSADWIYLSSLGEDSLEYHEKILQWMKNNPEAKLVFQPGTFQMKLGLEKMRGFYLRSDVFICNVEESRLILGNQKGDIKELLVDLRATGPKIVLITDGPKGAYSYDGKEMLYMPIYPDPKPPLERTGAGDAFASTLSVYLAKGMTLREALVRAPINSMSVVQEVGAQKGLLNADQIEEFLKNAPADYKPRII